MKYWYFLFEGKFRNKNVGVCSSALLPSINLETAQQYLQNRLELEGIELHSIEDQFEFKISEIDSSDEDNSGWISWYQSVVQCNDCVFTPWHTFDL